MGLHVSERVFVLIIIRVKFKKDDSVKYISHLDMMKSFQRAIRRAGLEAEYSQGFNPQMQMIFGAPLSLGFTSEAEYADFSFIKDYEPDYVVKKLNAVLPEGLKIQDAGIRTINKNIMADIMFAEYEFEISTGSEYDLAAGLMEAKTLLVDKFRKGRKKSVDVRPLLHYAEYKDGKLKVLVSAGNDVNLNPRLLVEAIKLNMDISAEAEGFNRTAQFVNREGQMVSPLETLALETK